MRRLTLPPHVPSADALYHGEGLLDAWIEAGGLVCEVRHAADFDRIVQGAFNLPTPAVAAMYSDLAEAQIPWGLLLDRINRQLEFEGLLDEGPRDTAPFAVVCWNCGAVLAPGKTSADCPCPVY